MSLNLLNSENQTQVNGPVDFIHQWIDMTNQEVELGNGTTVKTCKPAMGYSFAAGTTDGLGLSTSPKYLPCKAIALQPSLI